MHGVRILIAFTDVHAYALLTLSRVLRSCGVELLNLDPSVESSGQLVDAMSRFNPQVLALTTHIGKAPEYAKKLRADMEEAQIKALVIMGGKLNQNLDGELYISAISVVVGIYLLSLIGYFAFKAYHRRKDGIDISIAFKEIPPE